MAATTRALDGVLDDLRAESEEVERLVAVLRPAEWAAPTPAPGWTVAHQIAHLAWTDERAMLAAENPDGFRGETTGRSGVGSRTR